MRWQPPGDGRGAVARNSHAVSAGSGSPEKIGLKVDVLAPGVSAVTVQEHFPGARVVKSLNHLGYHQVDALPRGDPRPADG
jgi:predicted dinucleotide-binding enzyme